MKGIEGCNPSGRQFHTVESDFALRPPLRACQLVPLPRQAKATVECGTGVAFFCAGHSSPILWNIKWQSRRNSDLGIR